MENKKSNKVLWITFGLGVFFFLLVVGSSAPSNQTINDTQQVEPAPTGTAQADNNPQNNSVLTRKTFTGVVRTSVISFNKVMNINQQTIVFGGDEGALDDGTGSYCIINGDKNFANVVAGDTITATGELVPNSNALINCRVDSIK